METRMAQGDKEADKNGKKKNGNMIRMMDVEKQLYT